MNDKTRRGFLAALGLGTAAGVAAVAAAQPGGDFNSISYPIPMMNTFYVGSAAHGASDSFKGTTPGTAFATFYRAVEAVTKAGGGRIALGPYTFPVDGTVYGGLPSFTAVQGVNRGSSIIKVANARSHGLFNARYSTVTGTVGEQFIAISDLTVDGNSAIAVPGRASYAITFSGCSAVSIRNVTARNAVSDGLFINGLEVDSARGYWLEDLELYGSAGSGARIANGARACFHRNIYAHDNAGPYGYFIDASETVVDGVYAYGNAQSGIFIHNLFGSTFNNLVAAQNGQHGIRVQALIASSGSNWVAGNNSNAKPNTYHDVYFDDVSQYYGVSHDVTVSNVVCGPDNSRTWKPPHAQQVGQEAYGLYVDDGVATQRRVALLDVNATPGRSGAVRLPARTGAILYRSATSAGAPSLAAGAGLGAGAPAPSLAPDSDDERGALLAGTGRGTQPGPLVAVRFSAVMPATPFVLLTPANAATAALGAAYVTGVSAAGFTLALSTHPPDSRAAGTFQWNYSVLG